MFSIQKRFQILGLILCSLGFLFYSIAGHANDPQPANNSAPTGTVTGDMVKASSSSFGKLRANDFKPDLMDTKVAEQCNKAATEADEMCLESTSPKIVGAVSVINGLMSGADILGLNDVCSKYRKVMDVAKTAMTAFTAECAYHKYSCETTCTAESTKTATQLKGLNENLKSCLALPGGCPNAIQLKKMISRTEKSLSYIREVSANCNSYGTMIQSSVLSAASLLKRFTVAKQCEVQSGACAYDPTLKANDPTCVAKLDCSKAENDSNITCICMKAPRTAGCPGATPTSVSSPVMNSSSGNPAAGAAAAAVTPDPNMNLNQDLNPRFSAATPGGSSGNVANVPGAGPGGGGGHGADGGKGAALSKSSFNTNILSGDQGGGGGGGGGLRYGSGNSYQDSSGQYKAYLPGGANDPTRGVASQVKAVEVTGAGGEDNWDKVSSRYREAKPTLMGD